MKKTDEKNLLKFIDNEDNGMKVMGLSMDLSDDSDVRLRIKELAAPHLKDRSINVRNYLKQIK